MLRRSICALLGSSLFSISLLDGQSTISSASARHAICILYPNQSDTKGLVSFSQDNVTSPTKIVFSVVGLNPNCHHPIKIHEFGDLTNGCATTGNEYNLLKEKSNDKNENSLGVLSADILGNAYVCFKDSNIQLYGENSILGRSVVIHADPRVADKDETSLACGIIGRAKEFKTVPPFSEAK